MTLREWRKARGWNQTQAAKALGYSVTMVSDMERGRRGLTLRTVDKIARLTSGAVTRLDWPEEKTDANT